MILLRDIIKNLIKHVELKEVVGNLEISISAIQFDSRKIQTNDIFVAIRGTQSDGHQFIETAINNGAKVIFCEEMPETKHKNIVYIKVEDTSKLLSYLAAIFYDNPSTKLRLVGITGTNGKTTTATLLYRMFQKFGYKVGLISTVNYYVNDEKLDASHTTPDALQLNQLLDKMVRQECQYCFMEVSSHALVQHRVAALRFTGGLFSNITHDHLDYHKTFEEYIKAKKSFFDMLPASAFALVNADDKNGKIMIQNTKANKYTFGLTGFANFKARVIEEHPEGMQLEIDNEAVWTHFVGGFNAYNLLSVFATATLLGEQKIQILKALSDLFPVEGRFQTFYSKEGVMAIVDYAHTPDALENVLHTILEIKQKRAILVTVVGAGGDRDRTKRPKMAKIAAELSDKLILTSDNPRTEKPEDIIKEMEAGLDEAHKRKFISITDRREAIKTACSLAKNKGDIILIAGKGHETYQEINGVRHHFDDREIVQEYLN